jgi:taurine dioxygenase
MTATLAMEIRPLSAALGAEVRGVDLGRPMNDRIFGVLRDAFLQYHVLAFRDQRLSETRQLAFAARWGTPQAESNSSPAIVGFLYAPDLPPLGGDTAFANAVSAHETLEAGLRQRIQGMVRTIAETRRKAISLSQPAPRDQGAGESPTRAVIAHVTLPEHLYVHRWRAGDLVMWDNRCVLRSDTDFHWHSKPPPLRPVTVLGERLPS